MAGFQDDRAVTLKISLRNDKAATVGRRVLANLNEGRAEAIRKAQERARALVATVQALAHAELLSGKPMRGMAGRIARKLSGAWKKKKKTNVASERHVKRILDTLFSVSDSGVLNTVDDNRRARHAKRAA